MKAVFYPLLSISLLFSVYAEPSSDLELAIKKCWEAKKDIDRTKPYQETMEHCRKEMGELLSTYPHVGDHLYWSAMEILIGESDLSKRIEMLHETIPLLLEPDDRFPENQHLKSLKEDYSAQ